MTKIICTIVKNIKHGNASKNKKGRQFVRLSVSR